MSYWPASAAASGVMSGGSVVTRRGASGGRSSPQMLCPLRRGGKVAGPRSFRAVGGAGPKLFDRDRPRFDGSPVHGAEEREGSGPREAHGKGANVLDGRRGERGIVEGDAVGVVPRPDPRNAPSDAHRDGGGVVP